MTRELESIYCVQCMSVKPPDEAELVFRTGFYKVTMPLGRCLACANADRTAVVLRPQASDERSKGSSAKPA